MYHCSMLQTFCLLTSLLINLSFDIEEPSLIFLTPYNNGPHFDCTDKYQQITVT